MTYKVRSISNSDDIIDSRDVESRISDLEGELQDQFDEDNTVSCGTCEGEGEITPAPSDDIGSDVIACPDCNGTGQVPSEDTSSDLFEEWLKLRHDSDDDDACELLALRALADECEGYSRDWKHGETLIHDDYFEQYARDVAEDICGAAIREAHWPFDHIDWEAAADALQADYTSVDFDGATYWIRS